jgi:hypothetical protein
LIKNIDWDGIQALYRTATLSVREIARQYGISHTHISNRAKKENWTRDLSAKIAAGIKTAVVYNQFTNGDKGGNSPVNLKTEDAIVAAAIEEGKDCIIKHQRVGGKLIKNAESLADIVAERIAMPGELKASDLNFLAGANWRATSSAQIAVGIERQSRNLDTVATDPNAPTAIHITYHRADKIQQLSIDGKAKDRR